MLFALGFWLSFVTANAVAIYAFDYFERAWGRGPSLQVASWLAIELAVVALVGAIVGFRVGSKRGAVPGNLAALLLGILLTVLLGALSWVMSRLGLPEVVLSAASGIVVLAFGACALAFVATRVRTNAA